MYDSVLYTSLKTSYLSPFYAALTKLESFLRGFNEADLQIRCYNIARKQIVKVETVFSFKTFKRC